LLIKQVELSYDLSVKDTRAKASLDKGRLFVLVCDSILTI